MPVTVAKKLGNGEAVLALVEDITGQVSDLSVQMGQIRAAVVGDMGTTGLSEKMRALELQVLGIENARKLESLAGLAAALAKKEEERHTEDKEFRERIFRWLTAIGSLIGASTGVTGLLTR